MFETLARKARHLATDPVLRAWAWRRLTGRSPGPAAFTAHRPTYLNGVGVRPGETPAPPEAFAPLSTAEPTEPIDLPLPGLRLRLAPGAVGDVFARAYDDIETLLALHRFAWLPLSGGAEAESWAQVLWDRWRESFAEPDGGWAWHPYTAAERAINLLDLARRRGLPEPVADTVRLLARHADAIYARLEYFGDHDTSNHLSNNGRGLYRLGLDLGLETAAAAGARILEAEAARIVAPSGVLREGSSHYHLLIARNYADVWLAARRHGRPEAPMLGDIARRLLGVVPWLILPGGFPLIGDASPDCPTDHLLSLAGIDSGWVGTLPKADRKALLSLIEDVPAADGEALRGDGWLRLNYASWTGLWHAAPGGWPPMPGHGHQDTGSFEVHFADAPVFVDAGRGSYGEAGDAALYRSGQVHNTVLVDGEDPYPANRPYYDEPFRRHVGGPPPELAARGDEVVLTHHGFRRLLGVGGLCRRWRFEERRMVIRDSLEGVGRRRVRRIFATPLDAEADPAGIVLSRDGRTFHMHVPDAAPTVRPMTLWRGYGNGRPGRLIVLDTDVTLPWTGEVRLEVL